MEKAMVMLRDWTESKIEEWAGTTIYNRGYDYYENDMVRSLTYDPDSETLHAEVTGSSGDYGVEIGVVNAEINAYCDCPYPGYPCKHIVAVLLTFIAEPEEYLHAAKQQKQEWSLIEDKIKRLSKSELLKMITTCALRYPDFKRELMVQFQTDQKATLNLLLHQIEGTFPSIQSRSYSSEKIAYELDRILQSVENASETIKVEVNWAVVDAILRELNDYGMSDDNLEEVLFDASEALVAVLADDDSLTEKKQAIIGKLMDYYTRGNCGVVDDIYQTVTDLCSENSDYQIVIAKLEPYSRGSSYKLGLLANLYEIIGDQKAQRKTLERDLIYGMDYWRLAEYWIKKGDRQKALETVREGIKKGEGRKAELYNYLQQLYEEQHDYEELAKLLEMKLGKDEVGYEGLMDDPIYQSLQRYYVSRNDYPGQVKLLEMCLKQNDLEFKLYQEAERTLDKRDWPGFEQKLLGKLKEMVNKAQATWIWGGISRPLEVLAEIYDYQNNLEELFNLIKNHHALLVKYEPRLSTLQPDFYLQSYRTRVEELIAQRGRERYRSAVNYLKPIRKIYKSILKQPAAWNNYITQLKTQNKQLRALQEELRQL